MHVMLEKELCISNKSKAVSHLQFSTYLSCISFFLILALLMMRRGMLTPLFSQLIDWSQNLSYIRDICSSLCLGSSRGSSGLSDGCGMPRMGLGHLCLWAGWWSGYPLQCWYSGCHVLCGCLCLGPICGVLCLLDGSLLLLCSWAASNKIWVNKYPLLS